LSFDGIAGLRQERVPKDKLTHAERVDERSERYATASALGSMRRDKTEVFWAHWAIANQAAAEGVEILGYVLSDVRKSLGAR
jgi:hypothetical protein